jgi:hypothetical protein
MEVSISVSPAWFISSSKLSDSTGLMLYAEMWKPSCSAGEAVFTLDETWERPSDIPIDAVACVPSVSPPFRPMIVAVNENVPRSWMHRALTVWDGESGQVRSSRVCVVSVGGGRR